MSDLSYDLLNQWRKGKLEEVALLSGLDLGVALRGALKPLDPSVADRLVTLMADGKPKEWRKAADEALDDYEAILRKLFTETRPARDLLGMTSAAGAVGAATPSALGSGQSAAADGAAGPTPDGSAAYPSSECETCGDTGSCGRCINASEGGAGTDTGRSVPARGTCQNDCPPGIHRYINCEATS